MSHELKIKNKVFKNHKSSIVNRKFRSGFTLVELLIVIAIIGILSAILLANFVGVRQRARDAQRKSDLRQIQSALELYRSDNGSYPIGGSANEDPPTALYFDASAGGGVGVGTNCPPSSKFKSINGTVYMTKVPCNPSPIGGDFAPLNGNYFYYSATGLTYTLYVCLENANDQDPNAKTVGADSFCPLLSGNTVRKYYSLTQP